MNRFFRGAVSSIPTISPMNNSGYGSYMRPAVGSYPSYSTTTGYPLQGSQINWPQQQNPSSAPQQTIIPNQTNIIWIDNVEEIGHYPTGKGWQQWFGDKNDSILYVRDTDANGVIQPIIKLHYEVMEDPLPSTNDSNSVSSTSIPTYDGPTRDEFNELSKSVSSILSKLDELMK